MGNFFFQMLVYLLRIGIFMRKYFVYQILNHMSKLLCHNQRGRHNSIFWEKCITVFFFCKDIEVLFNFLCKSRFINRIAYCDKTRETSLLVTFTCILCKLMYIIIKLFDSIFWMPVFYRFHAESFHGLCHDVLLFCI